MHISNSVVASLSENSITKGVAKVLKRVAIALLVVMLTNISAFATEKIPREDFIKYADNCIDVIDELDVNPGLDRTVRETSALMGKYRICMRKFDRYGDLKGMDNRTLQYKIIKALSELGSELYLAESHIMAYDSIPNNMSEVIRTYSAVIGPGMVAYKDESKSKTK